MAKPNLVGPVPETLDADVLAAFKSMVEKIGVRAFDVGVYGKMEKSFAPSAGGLHFVIHMLEELLPIQPTARFKHKQLLTMLLQILKDNEQLKFNNTEYTNKVWAHFICRKIGIILHHYRSLAANPDKMRTACKKMGNAKEQKDLERLFKHFPIVVGSPKNRPSPQDSPPRPPKQRKLAPQISACSAASIPSLASSIGSLGADSSPLSSISPLHSRDDDLDDEEDDEPDDDSISQEAQATADAWQLPAGRGELKKLVHKRPAGKSRPEGISAILGKILLQVASEKSYVLFLEQNRSTGDQKWRLVVQSSHSQHASIITQVFEALQSDNTLDKAGAVAMKNNLQMPTDSEMAPPHLKNNYKYYSEESFFYFSSN